MRSTKKKNLLGGLHTRRERATEKGREGTKRAGVDRAEDSDFKAF